MRDRLQCLRGRGLRAVAAAGIAGGLSLLFGAAAQARTDVAPYLEVQQVLEAEFDGGEVLTYTSVAAGVDARVATRRTQVQVSYRYERRIGWEDDVADDDIHTGIAQAHVQLARPLSLDAGAIAARARSAGPGSRVGFVSAGDHDVAEVYGVYGGPTVSTHAGPVAVNASYRLAYVHVDDHSLAGTGAPGGLRDRYESATSHSVNASVGMAPGELPIGWTVAAGYEREEVDRLDQVYEGKFVRGDVVVPVSSTLALTAGVGYEKLEASQDDFVRGPDGLPVLTPGGHLIPDPARPRLLAYDQSGLIWDAGVIWRPNRRTELQARVGERYGGTTVVATLEYQINDHFGLSAVLYDSVTSFGRLVISNVSGLPSEFKFDNRGFTGGIGGGCIFGTEPGTGRCFDDAFQSIAGSNFRNRGVGILFSGGRGPWDVQVGLGYARRKYLTPDVDVFPLRGVVEESATLQAGLGRSLTRTSGLDFDAYASWYDSGIAGEDNVFSSGLTATYYRNFFYERLQGEASVGLYTTDAGGDASTIGAAMLGLRYQF